MSDGGAFALAFLGALCLSMFVVFLWTKYCVEIREPRREAEWNAGMQQRLGPLFEFEPMKPHIGTATSARTFRYRTPDWDAMRTSTKTRIPQP